MSASRNTISRVSAETKVPIHTLKFYIREGLLPPPNKIASNRGYYDGNFMARLAILLDLKERRKLPLKIIREILDQLGPDPSIADAELLLATRERLDTGSASDDGDPVPLDQLAAKSGSTQKLIKALADTGIIDIDEKKQCLCAADARIVEVIQSLERMGFSRSLGFTIRDFGLYREAMEKLVNLEMEKFHGRLFKKFKDRELKELVTAGTTQVDILLALMHKKTVLRALDKELAKREKKRHGG